MKIYPLKTVVYMLVLILVTAGARADDLRDWGKTFDFVERYVTLASLNNEAVLDRETQLVWELYPSKTAQNWSVARSVCRLKWTGKRMGWRLPSLHELSTLYHVEAGLIGTPFDLSNSAYWTSTSVADDVYDTYSSDMHAYIVKTYLNGGQPSDRVEKKQLWGVWCVRGISSTDTY